MGRGLYGQRIIQDWIEDKRKSPLKEGDISLLNVEYAMDMYRIKREFSRITTLNYFCMKRLSKSKYEENNYRCMLNSAIKQRDFCWAVYCNLEEWVVEPKWKRTFERDIKQLESRQQHVYRIVQENLKLTEYWPYFEAVGFERLLNFETEYREDPYDIVLDPLLTEIEAWNREHKDEVDAYMKKIQPELDRKIAFLARKEAMAEAEKEAERAKKKAAKDEEKMLKDQAKLNDRERRREEREFNSLMRRTSTPGWTS